MLTGHKAADAIIDFYNEDLLEIEQRLRELDPVVDAEEINRLRKSAEFSKGQLKILTASPSTINKPLQ